MTNVKMINPLLEQFKTPEKEHLIGFQRQTFNK